MKIKINKLFGEIDVDIDLNDRCSIFIGENGIGKSTVLKILYCILNQDYYSILQFEFESIDINNINVKYTEMMPSKEEFIKFGLKNCHDGENIYYEFLKNYSEYDYIELYKSLVRNELLERDSSVIIIHDLYEDFHDEELFIKGIYEYKRNIKNLENYFSVYSKKYNKLIMKDYDKTFFLNMVRDYKIDDRYEFKIDSKCDKEINLDFQIKFCEGFTSSMPHSDNTNTSKKYFKGLSESIKKIFGGESLDMIEKYENGYKSITKEEYLLNMKDSINKMFNEDYKNFLINKVIPLSQLLINISINPLYVKDLLGKYYDYMVSGKFTELLKNNKDKYQMKKVSNKDVSNGKHIDIKIDKQRLDYKHDRFFIENNILPLLPEESFFKEVFYYNPELYTYMLIEFCKECGFYKKFFTINSKLNKDTSIFNNYFYNKNIIITPRKLTVITRNGKELEYKNLSEGEKKLILLFLICTLYDDVILLLDEPETSLSILWQERLIPDLLDNTNIKNIIVASQSPFIAKDRRFDSCIKSILYEEEEYE